MCTDNMAGQKCSTKLKYLRNSSWFYSLFSLWVIYSITLCARAESSVLTVADANWTIILEGEWMLKFYAPWCPACQQIQTDWETFAKRSEGLGISIGKVDVTQQPGLSGRFLVTTLPTIFHAKDGSFRRYLSSRAVEDLRTYVSERKWEAVQPLPGWKSPSSIPMSAMAGLFRLSVWIRQIHSYLTDTLGVPVWGSYVIFGLATLFTGLFLGLMLVLIADCLCPSRPKRKEDKTAVYEKDEGSEDEMEDALMEEKRTSDADNESERVSGDESTEEEGPVPEGAACGAEQPEGAAESMVRRRNPKGANTPEGT